MRPLDSAKDKRKRDVLDFWEAEMAPACTALPPKTVLGMARMGWLQEGAAALTLEQNAQARMVGWD